MIRMHVGAAVGLFLAAISPLPALPDGFRAETIFTSADLRNPDPPFVGGFAGHANVLETLPDGRVFIGMMDMRGYLWDAIDGWAENGRGVLASPIFDYRGRIAGEMGIISCVADPDYTENGWFYVGYTLEIPPYDEEMVPADRRIRVERFAADPTDRTRIVPNSGTVIFDLVDDNLATVIHFGGGMAFGPEGELFLSLGDDGTPSRAQALDSFRGKVLRMDREGRPLADNPYYIDDTFRPENYIWARGLRNPYRIRHDSERNLLFAADTGQASWEEINVIQREGNYGWPAIEGPLAANPGRTPPANYHDPFWAYPHGAEPLQGYAVVGPLVYRGAMFPETYHGDLFVTDWGYALIREGSAGEIFHLDLDDDGNLVEASPFYMYPGEQPGAADMSVLPDGSLIVALAGYVTTDIRRISYVDPSTPPQVDFDLSIADGEAPLLISFESRVTSEHAFTLSWDFGDGATSTATNPSVVYTDPGRYLVTLTATTEFGATASASREIGVYTSSGSICLSGRLFDASSPNLPPLAGSVRLLEVNGSTPIRESSSGEDAAFDVNAVGAFFVCFEGLRLYGSQVVVEASAPGMVPLQSWFSAESNDWSIIAPLSPSAITGRAIFADGSPAADLDVHAMLSDGDGGGFVYTLPNDAAPPPTGLGGEYYFPLHPADSGADYTVSVNTAPSIPGYTSPPGAVFVPLSGTARHDFVLHRDSRPADCPTPEPLAEPIGFDTIQRLLVTNCVGCHGDTSPYAGLTLDDGFAYSSLVNRRSVELPTRFLVDQLGDVAGSFLLEKMGCAVPAFGAPMPPTSLVSELDRQRVATWIAAGAPPSQTRVALHAESNEATSGRAIQFHAGAEGPGAPFTFQWDFGDGTSSSLSSPNKAYFLDEESTTFTITLTALTADGSLLGRATTAIRVSPAVTAASLPPTLILPTRLVADMRRPLVISAAESFDPDGQITLYGWDLNNDGVYDVLSPKPFLARVWDSPGVYTVGVIAIDDANMSTTSTVEVFVPLQPAREVWMFR